ATTPWIELSGEEAHHAARVARLRPGDAVSVFDGAGLEAAGQKLRLGRNSPCSPAVIGNFQRNRDGSHAFGQVIVNIHQSGTVGALCSVNIRHHGQRSDIGR
ncbi:MAG TPA: hypothetical protein ENN29_07805, partial [Candidatus Hydrogenedentes bacterium]|nr:hypothetical protein [Candidatus Hydrogenedentota bacterium]